MGASSGVEVTIKYGLDGLSVLQKPNTHVKVIFHKVLVAFQIPVWRVIIQWTTGFDRRNFRDSFHDGLRELRHRPKSRSEGATTLPKVKGVLSPKGR